MLSISALAQGELEVGGIYKRGDGTIMKVVRKIDSGAFSHVYEVLTMPVPPVEIVDRVLANFETYAKKRVALKVMVPVTLRNRDTGEVRRESVYDTYKRTSAEYDFAHGLSTKAYDKFDVVANYEEPTLIQSIDGKKFVSQQMELYEGSLANEKFAESFRLLGIKNRATLETNLRNVAHLIVRMIEAYNLLQERGIINGKHFGLVHMDIKPKNVLIKKLGGVAIPYLGDLNLMVTGDYFAKKKFEIRGSRGYFAPEVVNGNAHGGKYVDLFSIGMLVRKLIFGETAADEFLKSKRSAGNSSASKENAAYIEAVSSEAKFVESLGKRMAEKDIDLSRHLHEMLARGNPELRSLVDLVLDVSRDFVEYDPLKRMKSAGAGKAGDFLNFPKVKPAKANLFIAFKRFGLDCWGLPAAI